MQICRGRVIHLDLLLIEKYNARLVFPPIPLKEVSMILLTSLEKVVRKTMQAQAIIHSS